MNKFSIFDGIETSFYISSMSFISIIYYILLHFLKIDSINITPLIILIILSTSCLFYFIKRYTTVENSNIEDIYKYLRTREYRNIDLKYKHKRSIIISSIILYFYLFLLCKVVNGLILGIILFEVYEISFILIAKKNERR